MKYLLLYNGLGVLWSLYLLVIHVSKKDHWSFQAILFCLSFMLFVRLLRKYSFSTGQACTHLIISFAAIYGGHWLFTWLVY
ncbi:hypothetical protein [Pontibacillus sp. HMF3514]|uniref:hypothetical protein n=1 Tax=Pontibacillus sp. HMF3514 TaxID=2692425 RepID=UPI00131FD14A|nr:hypothetical protein [Pontibacillus sp. HMF3514]QHE52035.1 hypothetical protein GS400_08335 [Pontibacillus sp. HMF3514]